MLDTVLNYLPMVLTVLGGLTAVAVALAGLAAAIAPLTKTELDDRLAGWLSGIVTALRWLQDKAAMFGLAKVAVVRPPGRVVDHRTKP